MDKFRDPVKTTKPQETNKQEPNHKKKVYVYYDQFALAQGGLEEFWRYLKKKLKNKKPEEAATVEESLPVLDEMEKSKIRKFPSDKVLVKRSQASENVSRHSNQPLNKERKHHASMDEKKFNRPTHQKSPRDDNHRENRYNSHRHRSYRRHADHYNDSNLKADSHHSTKSRASYPPKSRSQIYNSELRDTTSFRFREPQPSHLTTTFCKERTRPYKPRRQDTFKNDYPSLEMDRDLMTRSSHIHPKRFDTERPRSLKRDPQYPRENFYFEKQGYKRKGRQTTEDSILSKIPSKAYSRDVNNVPQFQGKKSNLKSSISKRKISFNDVPIEKDIDKDEPPSLEEAHTDVDKMFKKEVRIKPFAYPPSTRDKRTFIPRPPLIDKYDHVIKNIRNPRVFKTTNLIVAKETPLRRDHLIKSDDYSSRRKESFDKTTSYYYTEADGDTDDSEEIIYKITTIDDRDKRKIIPKDIKELTEKSKAKNSIDNKHNYKKEILKKDVQGKAHYIKQPHSLQKNKDPCYFISKVDPIYSGSKYVPFGKGLLDKEVDLFYRSDLDLQTLEIVRKLYQNSQELKKEEINIVREEYQNQLARHKTKDSTVKADQVKADLEKEEDFRILKELEELEEQERLAMAAGKPKEDCPLCYRNVKCPEIDKMHKEIEELLTRR